MSEDERRVLALCWAHTYRKPEEYQLINEFLLASLKHYAEEGQPPGDFLRAVLEDRLFEAMARADEQTALAMGALIRYITKHLPMGSYGCPALVEKWIQEHRQ